MKVLVIEDDKIALTSLKHCIESFGHVVDLAENAEQAMNKIVDGNYELVFTDIMMPGISGLSLLTILRTFHLQSTPIVAMSSLHNQSLIEAAYKAGANDFMVKPFTIDDVGARLTRFAAA